MALSPEERKLRQAAWYVANREAVIARVRKRAIEKRDQVAAYQKRWVDENKERVSAQRKAFREANKERLAAAHKQNYERRKDAIIANVKRYYAANKEKVLKAGRLRLKAWAQDNPERRKESFARRRARLKGARAETIDYKQILRAANGNCGICKKPLDLFGTEFDHIIPLARGGTHTQGNLQAAHALCNRSKGVKVA